MRHLIRRGAGAKDEALREAVPAERRVRAARESCQKHGGEDLLRHATPGTHLRARTVVARDWDGIYLTGAELVQHSQFPALFIEGTRSLLVPDELSTFG